MKKLIICVGSIGSGKSTYAKKLEAEGYLRISQDDQGKIGHYKKFQEAIESGTANVVIDRMNFNIAQRSRYWSVAMPYGYTVKIVEFKTPREICEYRALSRKDHPNIKAGDVKTVDKVLDFYYSNYEAPIDHEYSEYEVRYS